VTATEVRPVNVEFWDPDQAVPVGPIDEDLEGTCSSDRYGVTGDEEIRGEPLSVALAQEEPDVAPAEGADDQWVLVEDESDYGTVTYHDAGDRSAEELALHVESP
jgi:hypothetical protein